MSPESSRTYFWILGEIFLMWISCEVLQGSILVPGLFTVLMVKALNGPRPSQGGVIAGTGYLRAGLCKSSDIFCFLLCVHSSLRQNRLPLNHWGIFARCKQCFPLCEGSSSRENPEITLHTRDTRLSSRWAIDCACKTGFLNSLV